jgi:hypothetical protein
MAARMDDIAMAVLRRYAAAYERRRELTRQLHGDGAPQEPPPRRAPNGTQDLTADAGDPHDRGPAGIAARAEQLRQATAAFRTQAAALASRLAVLEPLRAELGAVRTQLLASSARLDHAVSAILTSALIQRASLRP